MSSRKPAAPSPAPAPTTSAMTTSPIRLEPNQAEALRSSGGRAGLAAPGTLSVMLGTPPQRPVLLWHLAGGLGERLQCRDDERAVRGGHAPQDPGDLAAAAPADLRHQLCTGAGERDPHHTAVVAGTSAGDQAFAHEPVAHASRRG